VPARRADAWAGSLTGRGWRDARPPDEQRQGDQHPGGEVTKRNGGAERAIAHAFRCAVLAAEQSLES
jgi:hypothetical protein